MRRAFTLTEVLVAGGVAVIMIGLVLSTVVAQSRYGAAIGNYSDMNEYSRKALTQFERDMRMARTINAMSATEVNVGVINSVTGVTDLAQGPTVEVYYALQDSSKYPGMKQLVRQSPKGSNTTLVLDGVAATGCQFAYLGTDEKPAETTLTVKKIIFTGKLSRSTLTTTNTDYLVSAVVVMRSKPSPRL